MATIEGHAATKGRAAMAVVVGSATAFRDRAATVEVERQTERRSYAWMYVGMHEARVGVQIIVNESLTR